MKSVVPLILALASTPLSAADAKNGEALHASQCIACHAAGFGGDGSGIYTRPNRRVQNLEALSRQVTRCKDNLRIAWFDDEVADVVTYLNSSYYHFEQE